MAKAVRKFEFCVLFLEKFLEQEILTPIQRYVNVTKI